MSIGMGLTFVPLTLTAVHHIKAQDSGIGSGVLNTMQQVGGALGLATLGTVSLHYINERVASIGPELSPGGRGRPAAPEKGASFLEAACFQATFTEGATHAFLVASLMMLAASLVVWIFLERQARGAGHRRARGRSRSSDAAAFDARRRDPAFALRAVSRVAAAPQRDEGLPGPRDDAPARPQVGLSTSCRRRRRGRGRACPASAAPAR